MARRSPRAGKQRITTRWVDCSQEESDRRAVAREMVAVLLARPQPPVGAAQARPVPDHQPGPHPPLAYQLIGKEVYWDGQRLAPINEEEAQRPLRPASVAPTKRKLEIPKPSVAASRAHENNPRKERRVSRSKQRPGQGGRPPKHEPDPLKPVEQQILELGPPQEQERMGMVRLFQWELNPHGNGVIFARISGPERKKGHTVNTQVRSGMALAQEEGLKPRYLVVTVDNTGKRKLSERPDLVRANQWMDEGWLGFEIWRSSERMFRRDSTSALHLELLQEHQVKLYLVEDRGEVDLRPGHMGRMLMRIRSEMDELEWQRIYDRTQGRVVDAFPGQGKGWPGAIRFGFKRDQDNYLVVDREQWDYVRFMFEYYQETGQPGNGGLRALTEELSRKGCDFSVSHVGQMLSDTIYADGHYFVNVRGDAIGQKRVRDFDTCEATQAISPELFKQVQDLRAARAGNTSRTPAGTFLLNTVPFLHAPCQEQRNTKNQQPRLRARNYSERPELAITYGHMPWVPKDDCCKGHTYPAGPLEGAAIDAVLQLARTRELPQEHARAARPKAKQRAPILDEATRAQLQDQITRLENKRDRAKDAFLERVARGEDLDETDHREMVGTYSQGITRLQAKLAMASQRRPAAEDPPPAGQEALIEHLEKVLTKEVPSDPVALAQRAHLFQACVSKIVLYEEGDEILLEVHGPLVPEDQQASVSQHSVLARVSQQRRQERNEVGPVAKVRREQAAEGEGGDGGESAGSAADGVAKGVVAGGEGQEKAGGVSEGVVGQSHTVRQALDYRTVCDNPGRYSQKAKPAVSEGVAGKQRPGFDLRHKSAWVKTVRVELATAKPTTAPAWTLEKVEAAFLEEVRARPELRPLTHMKYAALGKEGHLPTVYQLGKLASHHGMSSMDVRVRVMEAYWQENPQERPEGAWPPQGHSSRFPDVRSMVEAYAKLIAADPSLVPFTLTVQSGLPRSKDYPGAKTALNLRDPRVQWSDVRRWATRLAMRLANPEKAAEIERRRHQRAGAGLGSQPDVAPCSRRASQTVFGAAARRAEHEAAEAGGHLARVENHAGDPGGRDAAGRLRLRGARRHAQSAGDRAHRSAGRLRGDVGSKA